MHALPVILLGKAFKPNTNLSTGSAAVLLGNILTERGVPFRFADPHCEHAMTLSEVSASPAIILVSCKHTAFQHMTFAPGSVVLDPHRYIPHAERVTIKSIGVGLKK